MTWCRSSFQQRFIEVNKEIVCSHYISKWNVRRTFILYVLIRKSMDERLTFMHCNVDEAIKLWYTKWLIYHSLYMFECISDTSIDGYRQWNTTNIINTTIAHKRERETGYQVLTLLLERSRIKWQNIFFKCLLSIIFLL